MNYSCDASARGRTAEIAAMCTWVADQWQAFTAWWCKHPTEMGETYWAHGIEALLIALKLFGAAFVALVHAVCPFAFTHTASDIARKVVASVDKRAH
jgi:hypothetical protein